MTTLSIAPVLSADNTHLIVQEKLERYKKQLDKMEQKAKPENSEDEDEDEYEEKKRKQFSQKLILCTAQTKYRVIKKACRRLEFKLVDDENCDFDIYWSDTGIQP